MAEADMSRLLSRRTVSCSRRFADTVLNAVPSFYDCPKGIRDFGFQIGEKLLDRKRPTVHDWRKFIFISKHARHITDRSVFPYSPSTERQFAYLIEGSCFYVPLFGIGFEFNATQKERIGNGIHSPDDKQRRQAFLTSPNIAIQELDNVQQLMDTFHANLVRQFQ